MHQLVVLCFVMIKKSRGSKVPTKKHIPNFDTFGTLVDRLTIEVVKRSHFEFLIEFGGADVPELERKIAVQSEMIDELKRRLSDFLSEVFQNGVYEYIDEERTFL